MKIKAPFDSADEVHRLIRAGADELYCGVYHREWERAGAYPNAAAAAFRELQSLEELRAAVRSANVSRVPVYVTFNRQLPEQCRDLVCRDIERMIAIGVSGFIISDHTLIPFVRQQSAQCKIILSSIAPCFNACAVRFFKEQGADRIVLPLSQLSLTEITQLVAAMRGMSLESEVFVNNYTCRNINAFCLLHHAEYAPCAPQAKTTTRNTKRFLPGVARRLRRRVHKRLWGEPTPQSVLCRQDAAITAYRMPAQQGGVCVESKQYTGPALERVFAESYCVYCSVWALTRSGVTAGKLAGRGWPTKTKVREVGFLKQNLAYIEQQTPDEEEFVAQVRRTYENVFHQSCERKTCYGTAMRGERATMSAGEQK